MRTVSFSSMTTPSPSLSLSHHASPSRVASPISAMDEAMIVQAESMIVKWNPETTTFAKFTSLFNENRREAKDFLKCVSYLQKYMHFLHDDSSRTSEKLVPAQNLMQIAMKRLQKEFYQILSANRDHLDPESVSVRSSRSARSSTSDFDDSDGRPEDEIRIAGDSISEVEHVSTIAMDDLRSIAECMISTGYGKECSNIYKIIRKSIIDEGIYRLGVERLSYSRVNKMDSEALELKIKNWLDAVKIAVKTLFTGERILCDHVFAASDTMKESCFAEISSEGATHLFNFPELVAKSKRSRDMMFRALDLYAAISDHWPDIESIFSFESTSAVRSQALNSLVKLAETVRISLSEFESTIQKDSSKTLVPGGGIHSLTLSVMNELTLLADYATILSDLIADWTPSERSPLPDSYFDNFDSDESPAPVICVRFAWFILVLLCKLDGKSKQYKDVSLSYLFLANNLQYVVSKVRASNLKYLLGDDWISKHEAKVRQFAAKYELLGWTKVYSSVPENPTAVMTPEEVKDRFKKFNSAFDQAYQKQSTWIVTDSKLRNEIKLSISKKLLPAYGELYDTHRVTMDGQRDIAMVVRFAPENIENYLSDLFYGTLTTVTSSTSSSSSSTSRRSGLSWRSR